MNTYQHGGDIKTFANEVKCRVDEVIDLSSNINFVKPHIDIDFNKLDISAYPNYDNLYKNVAMHYDVKVDEMELYNGGSVAIFSLFRNLGLSECAVYSPAYLEYKKAANTFDYNLTNIDRFSSMNDEVKENSLVVFVNPSTPDGCHYDLDEKLEEWKAKNCTILVDESFIEFTNKTSIINKIKEYNKLYILKSMTKFFGSAGIRVATLISNNENIAKLKEVEALWKLSEFDSNYIQVVLKDKNFKSKSSIANKLAKECLLDTLKNSKYIKYIYPSDANFVLVELNAIKAKEFQKLLTPYKIMLRDCSNFDGLGEYHIRIAVKSLENMQKLKDVLDVC